MNTQYVGAVIKNIRRGRGPRVDWVYADLFDSVGNLLVSGTLEYITRILHERFPESA